MRAICFRTYLDPDLASEVTRMAHAQGRSESKLIADALRTLVASNSGSVKKAVAESEGRQLGRVEARLDKLYREQAHLKESFLMFVRVWLEHNPPIDEDHADSAAISAAARFEHFIGLALTDFVNAPPETDHYSDRPLQERHGRNGGAS